MSAKFPFYIHNLSELSEFLRDDNGFSVLGRGHDVGFAGYIKDAAISCFNAFNKADHRNQRVFFEKLIKEMAAYAQVEWGWGKEEVERSMVSILKAGQKERA